MRSVPSIPLETVCPRICQRIITAINITQVADRFNYDLCSDEVFAGFKCGCKKVATISVTLVNHLTNWNVAVVHAHGVPA